MKTTHVLTALALLSSLSMSEKLLAASQICGQLGGQDVVVPTDYAYSDVDYKDGTGYVTCDSKIQSLQIRVRPENLEDVSMQAGEFTRNDYLITLQPKSTEPKPSVKQLLKTIYSPSAYKKPSEFPYPKVTDGNGLIYVRGGQGKEASGRTDIYLKPNKNGNADFMIYCEVVRGAMEGRNCVLGYTDNEFGLNVMIKIGKSDVGNYKKIMQTASQAIEPIFSKSE